jgi:hypothetical protein
VKKILTHPNIFNFFDEIIQPKQFKSEFHQKQYTTIYISQNRHGGYLHSLKIVA